MANKQILVVPGDGIGQEVTAVGKRVLDKIALKFGHTFTYDEALVGHVAIEATGNPLPDETLTKMKRSEEHTSELQSLMLISYADFCLKKKTISIYNPPHT